MKVINITPIKTKNSNAILKKLNQKKKKHSSEKYYVYYIP